MNTRITEEKKMNNDVIVLKDGLDDDGVYRLHLMSSKPIEYPIPPHATVDSSVEMGTHILKAVWPYRGAITIDSAWSAVLWAILPGERVSSQAVTAAKMFKLFYGSFPVFMWVLELPKGIDNGHPVQIDDHVEMLLFQADFVIEGFFVVGSGELIEIDKEDD